MLRKLLTRALRQRQGILTTDSSSQPKPDASRQSPATDTSESHGRANDKGKYDPEDRGPIEVLPASVRCRTLRDKLLGYWAICLGLTSMIV